MSCPSTIMAAFENYGGKIGGQRRNMVPVVLAVVLAETLPILLLVAVVFVYSIIRQSDSLTPEEFATCGILSDNRIPCLPKNSHRAGMWVGPIGGFLAVFLFAWWVAQARSESKGRARRCRRCGNRSARSRFEHCPRRRGSHSPNLICLERRKNTGRRPCRLAGNAQLGQEVAVGE